MMMMIFNPHKVYAYFKDNYVLGKKSPKGWYNFSCPFCGKEGKAAVNFEWGYVKCWSCGASANVSEFVQQTENCSYYESKQILNRQITSGLDLDLLSEISTERTNTDITLPDGWQSLLDGTGVLGNRARAYLTGRGYDIEQLDFKGFGYCNKHHEDQNRDFFGYIVVPFKKDGVLSYYLGRDFIGNYLRYKNPPSDWVGVGKSDVIYNEEALHLYKTVYILEGWSDAETIGKKATATLGWTLSNIQLSKYHKSNSTKVFIPDAGTDKATGQTYYQKVVQVATGFIEGSNPIYVVDLNILSDYGKDVSEIGWDRVKEQVKQTAKLTWSNAMEIITT